MSQYNSFVPTVEFTPLTEDEIQEVLYEGVQADTRMQDALRIISKNLIIALEPRLSNYTHNLTAEMAGHMDAAFTTLAGQINQLLGQVTTLTTLVNTQQHLVESYKQQVDALPASAGGGHGRQPKIGEPPIFKGSEDKIKLEEWRNLISLWCAHEGIVTDKQKIVTALSKLQGPAHKYMESYYQRIGKNEDLGSWDTVMDELTQIYGQRDDKEGAKKEITALFNNKDLAAKDFINYAERFRTLGRLTGYDNELLIDKLREVIHRDMRIALVGKGSSQLPKTWTAFLDMLLEFYKELNPEKARGMVFSKSSADSSGYVPMDIDVTEKSQGKGKKKQMATATTDKKKFCHICHKNTHDTQDCYKLIQNADKRPKPKFQSNGNNQKTGGSGASASKPAKVKKTRVVQIEVTDDEDDTPKSSASISAARIEEEDTDNKSVLSEEDEPLTRSHRAKGKVVTSSNSDFLKRHL